MNRMRDNLDERVSEYFESQHPGETTLNRCRTTIISAGDTRPRVTSYRFATVAASLLLFMLALLFTISVSQEKSPGSRIRRIAAEIALNHHKQLPPEVLVETFLELRDALPALGFPPVRPRSKEFGDLDLVGARYCSITGRKAAQIRLTDGAGVVYTLYEFRDDSSLADIDIARLDIDGVRVTLWRESGMVMGLAGPQP